MGAYETVISERGVPYAMATTGVYAFNAERVVAEGIGWDIFTLAIAVPALLVVIIFGLAAAAGITLGFRMYADTSRVEADHRAPAQAAPAVAT